MNNNFLNFKDKLILEIGDNCKKVRFNMHYLSVQNPDLYWKNKIFIKNYGPNI